MPDIFQDGSQASRATFEAALEALRSNGAAVLADIDQARQSVLLSTERALSELNGKRQRAARIPVDTVAGVFLTSDFLDVDQSQTTTTVRSDSQAVTLQERNHPSDAVVQSTKFSADRGTVDSVGSTYRVLVLDGTNPIGTFELQMATPLSISLIVFDMVSMPSDPEITVSSSANGVRYTPAVRVSRSGYRVNAWLAPGSSVKYLRIQIAPSHPDTLGGGTFTFGITGFSAVAVDFHLRSEFTTRAVTIRPRAASLRFNADGTAGCAYFLSWDNQSFQEVLPGDVIQVPGSARVNAPGATIGSDGRIGHTLSPNVYLPTLRVQDSISAAAYRIAPGLTTAPPDNGNAYVAIPTPPAGGAVWLMPYTDTGDAPTFDLAYETGPYELSAWLRVQLSTSDRSLTPVFRGASLENL